MKGIKENASYHYDYFCSNIEQRARALSISGSGFTSVMLQGMVS
jgi:hypothetical protein